MENRYEITIDEITNLLNDRFEKLRNLDLQYDFKVDYFQRKHEDFLKICGMQCTPAIKDLHTLKKMDNRTLQALVLRENIVEEIFQLVQKVQNAQNGKISF